MCARPAKENVNAPILRLLVRPSVTGGAGFIGSHTVVSLVEAPPASTGNAPAGSLRAAAQKASAAVVSINTSKAAQRSPHEGDPWFRFFFGDRGNQPQAGLGSGVIISPEGYILTNNHVVADSDDIMVVLWNGEQLRARVAGRDPATDIAILRVTPRTPLTAAHWGDSKAARVGKWVLSLGNPFGLGSSASVAATWRPARRRRGPPRPASVPRLSFHPLVDA